MISPKICECGKQGFIKDSRQRLTYLCRRYVCECGLKWTTTEIRLGGGRGCRAEEAIIKQYSNLDRETIAKNLADMANLLSVYGQVIHGGN